MAYKSREQRKWVRSEKAKSLGALKENCVLNIMVTKRRRLKCHIKCDLLDTQESRLWEILSRGGIKKSPNPVKTID